MKSVEALYEEMKAAFASETGMELSDHGDLSVRMRAVAAQVYALYLQSEWVRRQCFPQTAEGELLDQHAALRGIERRAAMPSVGVIRFFASEPAVADCAIEKGTVCMTTGLVRFETTEEAVLRQGETETRVAAQAVEAGAGGNVAAGTIVRMTVPPVGISGCSNPEAFTGGLDAEEDEALRSRVMRLLLERTPTGKKDVGAAHIQALLALAESGGLLALPGGLRAVCRDGWLRLTVRQEPPPEMTLRQGVNRWGDFDITLRGGESRRVTVRTWSSADRMTVGRGSRSLKRLFSDAGIPPERRDTAPVVCVDGAPYAVYGVGERVSPENGESIKIIINKRENHKEDTGNG